MGSIMTIPAHLHIINEYDCEILESKNDGMTYIGSNSIEKTRWICDSETKVYHNLKIHGLKCKANWCSCTSRNDHHTDVYKDRIYAKQQSNKEYNMCVGVITASIAGLLFFNKK